MRVLYIDAVGPFGGASRSLFESVQALAAGPVDAYFVMQQGTAQDFYGKVAKDLIATRGLTRFDNTRASHYHGVRWIVLLREIFHFPFTLAAMLRAKRRWRHVALIHVNELLDIVPGLIAGWLFRAPMVVHVRSLQWLNAGSLRTRWVNARLRNAAAVVAIDENTRATLPNDLTVDVIQNSFTPKRAADPDPSMLARLDRLRPGSLKVGFVGNLHRSKGIFELLDAARLLRDANIDVEFVIVGGVTITDRGLKAWALARAGLAENIQAELTRLVGSYGLGDCFHLLGPTTDIQPVYERLDVLCFPSYYDAPGRPVFEAAFSGVPSIVCVDNPLPDTLVHGETGLAIPAKSASKLAEAIAHFANDRAEVHRMGKHARALAEANFEPKANARRLLAVYERVLAAQPHGQPDHD